MGAAESIIRNVDKRTSRRNNRDRYEEAIGSFRRYISGEISPEFPAELSRIYDDLQRKKGSQRSSKDVMVCVRKRPIFQHELAEKEFDVVTTEGHSGSVYIHDARMEADMKHRYLDHHRFEFDVAFGEEDDSESLYTTVVKPLVERVGVSKGKKSVIMYGQTGSGKTFTMTAMHKLVAEGLFQRKSATQRVLLSFVELRGDSCFDVLNMDEKLQIVSFDDQDVAAYPVTEVEVSSPHELVEMTEFASAMRSTASTGVHDASSRSHALCTIHVIDNVTKEAGRLTMVDLAGSEMSLDSREHNVARRKESAQINSSLMKLKECVRAKSSGQSYIPYRQSKLTYLLKPAFDQESSGCNTVVIATVSPSSKDTEHSLNTLRHACIMHGQGEGEETRWVSGGVKVKEPLGPINVTALARQAKAKHGRKTAKTRQQQRHTVAAFQNRDGSFDQVAQKMSEKKAARQKANRRRASEAAGLGRLGNALVEKLHHARETRGQRHRALLSESNRRARLRAMEAAAQKPASPGVSKPPRDSRCVAKDPKVTKVRKDPNVTKVTKDPKTLDADVEVNEPEQVLDVDRRLESESSAKPKPNVTATEREKIRREVWEDERIPDDCKEEEIVRRVRIRRESKSHQAQEQSPPLASTSELMWLDTGEQRQSRSPAPSDSVNTNGPAGLHVSGGSLNDSKRPTQNRHELARARKNRLVEQEKQRLAAKLRSKEGLPQGRDADVEIGKLEAEITRRSGDGVTSRAAIHGLKARLARMKADRKRELRKLQMKQELEGFIPYS